MMEYFYREQAEQFDHICVPKALIYDKDFSHLSDSAEMLYGCLKRWGMLVITAGLTK